MIQRYEVYKESGISWIGEIPEHWKIVRLKDVCLQEKNAIKTGPFGSHLKGDDLKLTGDVPVYNQRNVIDGNFDDIKYFVSSQKAEQLSNFFTKHNDLLITARGTIGRAAILDEIYPNGIIHPCLIAIRLDRQKCHLNWLLYFINDTSVFTDEIIINSNATTIDVIYTGTLKNIHIPLPPYEEQRAIAEYLDREVSRIDRIVELLTAQQERYDQLKRSLITEVITKGLPHQDPSTKGDNNSNRIIFDRGGILHWIEKIPEHWEVKYGKRIYIKCDGGVWGENPIGDGTDTIVLRSTEQDVDGYLRIEEPAYRLLTNEERKRCLLIQGDLIITKSSGSHEHIGKTSIIDEHTASLNCCYSNFLQRIRIRGNSKYYWYAFNSNVVRDQFKLMATSTTGLGNLSLSIIKNIFLPIPPLEEQSEIVEYLDERCSRIDRISELIGRKIELMESLKKSLIEEVVTGQRCVVN